MDMPRLTLRVDLGSGRALGPGKIRLVLVADPDGGVGLTAEVADPEAVEWGLGRFLGDEFGTHEIEQYRGITAAIAWCDALPADTIKPA
jgi:hypothetical protein